MKIKLLFAACALAGAASAQSITVDSGMWTSSSDGGGYVIADGTKKDMPSEHSSATECWSTLKDRTLSAESMGLESCVIHSKARYGQRLEFEMSCVDNGVPMDGNMVVIMSPDAESVLASFIAKAEAPGLSVVAWSDMWFRRVGAC